MLLQFLNDGLLVGGRERRGAKDLGKLCVLLENAAERLERLCGGVESIGFGGRSVLPTEC